MHIRILQKGNIDVLTSMKCLDVKVLTFREAESAIFSAKKIEILDNLFNVGGRVPRTHDDKRFAIIHDLVVIPPDKL